jgi:hypothetical protein
MRAAPTTTSRRSASPCSLPVGAARGLKRPAPALEAAARQHLRCWRVATPALRRLARSCARGAGGVELDKPEYSGGVRQELHKLAGQIKQDDIQIHKGGVEDYWARMMRSK